MLIGHNPHAGSAAAPRTVLSRIRAVRLNVLVRGWLIGTALVFALYVVRMPGPVDSTGHRPGGDILQFYAAGHMVLTGRGADLYDLKAQAGAQQELAAPTEWPHVAPYLNPPILAAAWAPFAGLPFKAAYVASTCALLGALLIGLRALRPHVPALHAQWPLVVGLTILFLPIFRTVTGGQNTAITFALLAGGYASLRRQRDGWAGIWLGLLLYKPQYAVLPALLLMVSKRWSAVVAFALTAVAQYIVGVAISGVDWPLRFVRLLEYVMPLGLVNDGPQLISWLNFAQYAVPGRFGKSVGTVLAFTTFAALVWVWSGRPRRWKDARTTLFGRPDVRTASFASSFGATVAATLACSPYTQWYESGLLIIPALLGIDQVIGRTGAPTPTALRGLAAGFLCVPLYHLAPLLGWQPLALLAPLVLAWLIRIQTDEVGHSHR